MKRFIISTMLLAALLLFTTACAGNSASQENQDSDTTNQGQFREGKNNDTDGGRNSQGGQGSPG